MAKKFSNVLKASTSFACISVLALVALITFLASSFSGVDASVMGIDFGTESIKIAAPKNNNMEIILNEQSHRKSWNAVGFRGDERFFADEAKNLAARFPDNMFLGVNRLVGVNINNTKIHKDWYRESLQYTPKIEEFLGYVDTRASEEDGGNKTTSERGIAGVSGTIQLRTGSNPDVAYSAETLTAMIFTYIKNTVDKDTKLKITDAVVTVPAYYDKAQRQATIDAAELAGVRVISLTHPTTAAAIQFGMNKRGFGNESVNLLIIDVGAAHTDVGVYTFNPTPVPAGKKGKPGKVRNAEALGTVTTRSIVSTNEIGGRIFDSCLAKYIEDKFIASNPKTNQRVLGGETLQKRKAIVSLMRAANKAKEMLSANRAAPVIVEGIAPDRDFPITIKREDFESACSPLFESIPNIVNEALSRADLKMEDMIAFELFGAGSRIPRIVEDMSKMRTDGKPVDRTLNTDEAAALGAGFYAGALAGRFRIKCFGVSETVGSISQLGSPSRFVEQNMTFSLTPKPNADPSKPPVYRTLYHINSKFGAHKSVTLQRDEDFGMYIYRSFLDNEKPDTINHETTRVVDRFINVTGIQTALESCQYYFAPEAAATPVNDEEEDSEKKKSEEETAAEKPSIKTIGGRALRHPNNTHQVKVEFRLSESGLLEVESAELRATYMQNISKKIRVNLTEDEIEEAKEKARARVIAAEEARLARKAEEEAAKKANETAEAEAGEENNNNNSSTEESSEEQQQQEESTTNETETEDSSSNDNETADGSNSTSSSKKKKPAVKKEENATAVLERKLNIALKAVRTYRVETKYVEEARKKSVPLSTTSSFPAPTPHMPIDKTLAKRILRSLDDVDRLKRETAAAKNDLEGYIIWCKNEGILDNQQLRDLKLLENETLEKEIVDALAAATEWLEEGEGYGDDVSKDAFVDKLKELHLVTSPVLEKFTELTQPKKKKATSKKSSTTKKSKKPTKKSADADSESEGEEEETSNTNEETNADDNEQQENGNENEQQQEPNQDSEEQEEDSKNTKEDESSSDKTEGDL